MPFDLKAFDKTQFNQRTADVPVPELKDFFGDDEAPVWKVRYLTAPEIAKVEMSGQTAEKMLAVIEGITSDKPKDIADAVKGIVGIADDLDPEFRKHLTRLEVGSVEPKIIRQTAVKLANVSPTAFYRIIAKIKELSGQGAEMGKLQASGNAKKSKTQ